MSPSDVLDMDHEKIWPTLVNLFDCGSPVIVGTWFIHPGNADRLTSTWFGSFPTSNWHSLGAIPVRSRTLFADLLAIALSRSSSVTGVLGHPDIAGRLSRLNRLCHLCSAFWSASLIWRRFRRPRSRRSSLASKGISEACSTASGVDLPSSPRSPSRGCSPCCTPR